MEAKYARRIARAAHRISARKAASYIRYDFPCIYEIFGAACAGNLSTWVEELPWWSFEVLEKALYKVEEDETGGYYISWSQ